MKTGPIKSENVKVFLHFDNMFHGTLPINLLNSKTNRIFTGINMVQAFKTLQSTNIADCMHRVNSA